MTLNAKQVRLIQVLEIKPHQQATELGSIRKMVVDMGNACDTPAISLSREDEMVRMTVNLSRLLFIGTQNFIFPWIF